MKNILLLFILALFFSCNSSNNLDRVFKQETYDTRDFALLQKDIDMSDLFLINYALLRQRDYYNFEVKGKTYREILAQAKTFQKEGMGINEVFEKNGEQNLLEAKTRTEGSGATKVKGTSSYEKQAMFSCLYTNKTNKNVALEMSSFLIQGPFKSHLGRVGYEINCVVPANDTLRVRFITDANTLKNNLLFEGTGNTRYIFADSLFNHQSYIPLGHTVTTKYVADFRNCTKDYGRRKEFTRFNYRNDFDATKQVKSENGKTTINFGKGHYLLDEKNEPIHMQ